MNTNTEVKNKYLRSLLARELLGYRKSHWGCMRIGLDDRKSYVTKKQTCRRSFGRVDLHLRLYPEAVMAGDPTPLEKYPASFAGH